MTATEDWLCGSKTRTVAAHSSQQWCP